MDIFSVYQGGKILYSHLNITWGLIADIDIESERFRYLGMARVTVAALLRIMNLRSYRGDIYYLPAEPNDEGNVENPKPLEERDIGEKVAEVVVPPEDGGAEDDPLILKEYPEHNGPKLQYLMQGTVYFFTHHLVTYIDYKKWPGKVLNSNFTSFNLTNLAWIAPDFLASPTAKLTTSALDLIYSDDSLTNFELLSKFADNTQAQYLHLKQVVHKKVRSLFLIPKGRIVGKDKVDATKGIISLSGESIPHEPFRIEVHTALMNVLAPLHLNENDWESEFVVGSGALDTSKIL